MLLIFAICSGFAAALIAPSLHRYCGDQTGKLLALVPFASFITFLTLIPQVRDGNPATLHLEWIPSIGISFSFHIDGLSLLFLLIISGVGTCISLFAGSYLHGDRNRGRFFAYFLSFMAAMLGVVAADNLILLFIFWELTSITSYLLIGYYNEKEASRRAALQALVVTGGGGLAMLAGVIVMGNAAGTFSIAEINALEIPMSAHALYPVFLFLILLGAFTKSAQFPFHFWLPNAMEAPAPVSAFLHSATMVKAGVFLMARLHPSLAGHDLWLWTVGPIGALTFLTGVVIGMGQTDLKKILAYTTLSVLGILTLLLGIGTDLAIKAAMTYLLAHALYKAALFMAAGTVDHETGSRDVTQLSGLRHKMPLTATAALVGGLSMAGLPLLFGFIGKEYFYKAALYAEAPLGIWPLIAVGGSIPMVALALLAAIRPFWGPLAATPKHAHEGPWPMWSGPIALGGLSLLFGLYPALAAEQLIGPASRAVLGDPAFVASLKLWDGWSTALLLSALTVLAGVGLYLASDRIRHATASLRHCAKVGPEAGYFSFLDGIVWTAKASSRILQYGYLRVYLMIIIGFIFILFLLRSPMEFMHVDQIEPHSIRFIDITICLALVIGAITACASSTRLVAIAALGVTGVGVTLLFALYSAPDLAITQFLVETLSVILLLFAFQKLPRLKNYNSRAGHARDILFSVTFGAVITMLLIMAMNYQIAPSISPYYLDNSYVLAQGKNIVNVILVDFRALDTMGEIIVLAVAALAIVAMIRLRLSPSARKDDSK